MHTFPLIFYPLEQIRRSHVVCILCFGEKSLVYIGLHSQYWEWRKSEFFHAGLNARMLHKSLDLLERVHFKKYPHTLHSPLLVRETLKFKGVKTHTAPRLMRERASKRKSAGGGFWDFKADVECALLERIQKAIKYSSAKVFSVVSADFFSSLCSTRMRKKKHRTEGFSAVSCGRLSERFSHRAAHCH
jgi:hypothetical protein